MTTVLTAPVPDTDPQVKAVEPVQPAPASVPIISFDLYIITSGAVFHMEAAPASAFQTWIESVMTEHEADAEIHTRIEAARGLAWPTSARWRTISDLAESGIILPLYASQAQAERVLQAQIERKSEQQGEDHE
jgi:hypothetical protein